MRFSGVEELNKDRLYRLIHANRAAERLITRESLHKPIDRSTDKRVII